MKITVYGAGPIGLTTSLGLCQMGHQVLCIDIDQEKITRLQENTMPFYEPGLASLLEAHLKNKSIQFSYHFSQGLENSVHFIAIGTPNIKGIPQTSSLEKLTTDILSANPDHYVFIKSTVPPGTAECIKKSLISLKALSSKVKLISHPEFLREGSALQDFLKPDRLVFGGVDLNLEFLKSIYPGIASDKFLLMSHSEAELSKYLANAYLAQRVSFINQAAFLCETFDADIKFIKAALTSDHRIGEKFLNPGLGFGGSCFPKDLQALNFLATTENFELPLVQSTLKINDEQIHRFTEKIESYFLAHQLKKKVCLWGLSFKPNTNDLRESPAIKVLKNLLKLNYTVHVHDPVSKNEFLKLFSDQITNNSVLFYKDPLKALTDCNALVLATEWREYKEIPLSSIFKNLSYAALFDGRNHFDKAEALKLGFYYAGVGR